MSILLALVVAMEVGPPVAVEAPAAAQTEPRVSCGGDTCVVAWQLAGSSQAGTRAVRVRKSDGAVLDSPAKALAPLAEDFDIAFDGLNFVYVWGTSTQVRLNALRASDGALLAGDALTGGQPVVEERGVTPSVGCLQGTCLVIWGRRLNPFQMHTYGRRWRRSDATLLDAAPVPLATDTDKNQAPLEVTPGATHLMAAVVDGFLGESPASFTLPILVAPGDGSQIRSTGLFFHVTSGWPAPPVFDGSHFAFAVARSAQVVVARMREDDRTVSPSPMGAFFGSGEDPQLAFDGRNLVLALAHEGTWRGTLLQPSDLTVVEGGPGAQGFLLAPPTTGKMVGAGAGGGRSLWAYATRDPIPGVFFRLVDDGAPGEADASPDGLAPPDAGPEPVDMAPDAGPEPVDMAPDGPDPVDTPPVDMPPVEVDARSEAPDADFPGAERPAAEAGPADGRDGGFPPIPEVEGCACSLSGRSADSGASSALLALFLVGFVTLRRARRGARFKRPPGGGGSRPTSIGPA